MNVEGYVVGQAVARGGFAQVSMATQAATGRVVALKVLDRIGEKEEKRFAREFESLQRLSHDPNIVDVIEITRADDGSPCIVLEYMSGGSIEDLIQANPGGLPESDVAYVADRILQALAAAHDHGVIHRDVKPSNVLLGNGGVKLSDFGIAKFADSSGTTSAAISTTVLYAAPEVLMNRGATERSDLYSLGSMVVTMLTGQPVHDSVPAALAAAATGSPPEPALPGVSDGFAVWIRRMVAPDASDRFATTEDARRALRGLTPSEPSPVLAQLMGATASPASFDGPTQTVTVAKTPETSTIYFEPLPAEPTSRYPVGSVVGALVVVVGLLAGGWYLLLRPTDADGAVDAVDAISDTSVAPPTTSMTSQTEPTTGGFETTAPTTTTTSDLGTTGGTPPTAPPDADGDGVANTDDECPGTTAGDAVDGEGCSARQVDEDLDGVRNDRPDECPNTPRGADVDPGGCSMDERDGDGDGVPKSRDCDDTDPARHGPPEIPGNEVDEDCDGVADQFCDVQPIRFGSLELQAWATEVRPGADNEFGGNAVQVTADLFSSWSDQRFVLRLAMAAEGLGDENSAGSGSQEREIFAVGRNERIVDVRWAGGSLPRNDFVDVMPPTVDEEHGAENVPGAGLVGNWRVVADTSGPDVGNNQGDDDANVTASLRPLEVLVESERGGCVPN